MSDNIKVVVKVRPLISREIEDKLSFQWRVRNNTLVQLDPSGKDSTVQFTFDKVYDVSTKTTDVYDDVAKPIVEAAIAGFNGTIFAYGQTSSGKTYTMSGTENSSGIIQLAVLNLFEKIRCIPDRDFLVRVSYIEIYNETLKDLLNCDNDKIKIRENPQGGLKLEATEKFTSSPKEVMDIMKEGEANRQIGATNMNEKSSRSHSIFQITIESREHIEGEETAGCVNVSQLNLVDLAGSERSGQTGATGKRFKEGTHINKSLSVLALVIKQLSEDPHKHANYRDSKLTRILQNSLGGNAKTSIICAVTPAAVEETISTLQFANRAKAIKNKPEVNAVATDATKLQDLTKQLSKLQSELASKNNIEQDYRLLHKQMQNLQKMILNGFGQRSMDIGGARRKTWNAPRRMTISTTSLRTGDEDETTVQRFRTPTLKYNPLSVPTPRDFQPIQRPSQLPVVSEERSMVTPPPKDKKVNFSEEIIDLDSDEDTSNTGCSSPYHKCYNASKTPPCVLRNNAKKAEESLRDIVELTNREKMYNPDVVEYMEKLEQSTNKVAKLEDEIKCLSTQNKEKDLEMKQLQDTISKTKSEVVSITNIKAEIEARCNDYNTKLTDLEFSYETLKAKAKLRESELLSLLNEQSGNKNIKESMSGKTLSKTFEKDFSNFMDMSKDISLVSDNDSSIDSSNNEHTGQLLRLVDEMRTEVTAKNDAIVQLESNLSEQKRTIESIENTCKELREQILETNSKLKFTEEENSLLKSSIETFNSTINSQKQNLESANNDIQSYNIIIKELQDKLTNKKIDSVDLNIADISLEKMIHNEEKIIANNENIRNIINSFKIALETQNKKIELLQSSNKPETSSDILIQQLEEKEKEINSFIEEANKSKEQIQDNENVISKLMEENKVLIKNVEDLSDKLMNAEKQCGEIEIRNLELSKENTFYVNQLHEFNEKHDTLLKNLNDFKNNISILQKEKEELLELQRDVLCKDNLIAELKFQISSKDSLVTSLNTEQIESHKYLCQWKSSVTKLQEILSLHTCDANIQTELTDYQSIYDLLSRQITIVKNSVKEVLSQKELAIVNYSKLEEEVKAIQSRLNSLTQEKKEIENDIDNKNQRITELTENLREVREESIEVTKQIADLNTKVQLSNEKNDCLNRDLVEKENTITYIKNEEYTLRLQLESACKALEVISGHKIKSLQSLLNMNQAKFDETLQATTNEFLDLKSDFAKKDRLLDESHIELQKLSKTLEETVCNRDHLLHNIYKAAFILISKLDNQIDEHLLANNAHSNVYNQIIQILDKVRNDVETLQLMKSVNGNNNNDKLKETIELLDMTKEQNLQLISKLSYTEIENNALAIELEQMKKDNKKMSNDLLKSDEVLNQLQIELREKLFVIECLETKISEWKEKFNASEDTMKQQLLQFQISHSDLDLQLPKENQRNNETIVKDTEFIKSDAGHTIRKSFTGLLVEPGNYSPQSLVTLSCNTIIDIIQTNATEVQSVASTTNINCLPASAERDTCDCDRLLTENSIALEENLELKAKVDFLQSANIDLLKEQEEIRKELKLLMEPAQELQKKISSHKTNVSTLTATTYAENKLLKSQVKVLQHHNDRIYNVCQRDLPAFKKSLQELSSILKNTPSINRLEANIKRFSLPELLDRNNSAFKDESTLDGDLLMLDTNVTIASVDNTLVQDQTYLDGTHVYLETEFNTDVIETIDPNILHTQLQMLSAENGKLTEKLKALKEENIILHEEIEKHSESSKSGVRKIDTQRRPINNNSNLEGNAIDTFANNRIPDKLCEYCNAGNKSSNNEKITDELNKLSQELLEVKLQKSHFEQNYNNIVLKISALENNNKKQSNIIDQLNNKLSFKHEELAKLQEEYDLLSTQVMESIDETDSLRKEVDSLKDSNTKLSEKCANLEELKSDIIEVCVRCARNTSISPGRRKSGLNRSRSDSESSSRCNKLSTLQHELLAGREDCKTISEDVATIKNHLERGKLSMSHDMDIDDSMCGSNVFSFTTELHEASPKANQLTTEIPEERQGDMYALDKSTCFSYYIEKTGAETNLPEEIKIIDVMKMFYDNLIAKHGNEVENLVNKLKDYEESKTELHEKLSSISSEYSKLNEEKIEKDHRIDGITNTLNILRNNIHNLKDEICSCDADKNTVLVAMFKNNVLSILDNDFDLSSVNIFENLIDKVVKKHQSDLVETMNRYSELQEHMEILTSELNSVTDILTHMKCQLTEKEKEYNLLKSQKEKVHEITSAVTMDMVQKEKKLSKVISNGCQKLIEHSVLTQSDLDSNLPVDENVSIIIATLINLSLQNDVVLQEKHNLALEVASSKTVLEEKDQELESLKSQVEQLREICKNATSELQIKNEAFKAQKSLHEQLNEVYEKKVEENDANAKVIDGLTQEIEILKVTVSEKDSLLQNIEVQTNAQNSNESQTKARLAELMDSINSLEHENKNLKAINEMITNESELNAAQLAQADNTIKTSKTELDKLTSEILILNQSMKESMCVIENLKLEAKTLLEQNVALKKQFEEAKELCSQLKLNIKTHEKTAEIQCKIISRLKKEKELPEQCETLQSQVQRITEEMIKNKHEAEELREAKEALEHRIVELESQLESSRSRGSFGDSRRRRQSLLDSKRAFSDDKLEQDHKKMEAYFSTQDQPEDMFMDVDDHSNRSTPARNRRSDSFPSRNDESDEPSRPSSSMARRRHRQSIHDLNRNTHHELQDHPNRLDEQNTTNDGNGDSESLKERLKLCHQELEELRERYREVDEECDTCAEYLRERDAQCVQLKAENTNLQQQITKLNEKLQNASMVRGKKDAQRSFADASVNTDEDWANLHSVVVDRMSFDREVERNKALQRSVDELRFKNGELKATLAKTQKSVERAARNKANLQELEATKLELDTCKRELEEYKERCKELDEECETCGEYLRERDEQVCRLKEARDALEAKLEALQEKEAGSKAQSVRKKRQSMHDQNRDSVAVEFRDVATETSEELYSYYVDNSKLFNESLQSNENIQLKLALEKMSYQKHALEMQLRSAPVPLMPPVYVATGSGIVQNQHLTEVMKENQKLKRMNAKLITICKKRGKPLGEANRENDDPADMG